MSSSKDLTDDDKIIRMPDLDYKPDPRGTGYVFYDCMKKNKDKIAQINGITGETDTYGSLLQRCIRTAIKMRSMGITHEDIITLCTYNDLNTCVPYIAGLFIGAKVSALDPTLTVEDATHLLTQVTPKLLFVGIEAIDLIEKCIAKAQKDVDIVIYGSSDKYKSFDEFLKVNQEEKYFEPHPAKNLRDTAIILFSSGTSGLPKGICIHHYGFLCQHQNVLNFKYNQSIYLTASNFYWVSACSALASTVMEGTARLILPKFNPEAFWNAIHKFRPTLVLAVPFHFVTLYRNRPKNIDTSSVVNTLVGGGALIESQMRNIQSMFPSAEISSGYGQTEMTVLLTVFKPSCRRDMELSKTKLTSCGTGISGFWYKIVDTETEELLGPNQPGELRVKTDFCLKGYYNMDSSHLWDKDGWYKTGDYVYYDEDKCFYVVDRLKEFLKYQFWHVPPAQLETILTQHPEVASALVIGIPHEVDENHLMGLVVLKNKNSQVTAEEIKNYVNEQVDHRKRLVGGVKIVDAIPMAGTGKIKRREVRDMVLRGEL